MKENLKTCFKICFYNNIWGKRSFIKFLFLFILWLLAFWSHLEFTLFLKKLRLLTLNPLSFVDNLLYRTQKTTIFCNIKSNETKT
jgi:hypothetical protein